MVFIVYYLRSRLYLTKLNVNTCRSDGKRFIPIYTSIQFQQNKQKHKTNTF